MKFPDYRPAVQIVSWFNKPVRQSTCPTVRLAPLSEGIVTMTNDFEYVDGIVCRAEVRKSADGIGALSIEERHATAIWAAAGVIGNGGFQYFFENDLSGVETAEAYDAIGMPMTAGIFHTALSLFPGSKPQSDWSEALAFIRSKEELFYKLSEAVWDSKTEMTSRLASYLRTANIR